MAEQDLARCAVDELEIRNIIARLAQLADDGDLDEYVSLFAEDGIWNFGKMRRRGRADIMAGAKERRAAKTQGPGTNTRHVATTTAVKLQGEAATARSYILFYKNTNTAPTPALMVVYDDQFQRVQGQWKLAARNISPA